MEDEATFDGQPCKLFSEVDMSKEAPTIQELSCVLAPTPRVGSIAVLEQAHLDLLDLHLIGSERRLSALQRSALRWYAKACAESNVFDRFIGQWIAFSLQYGPLVTNGERSAFDAFIRASLDLGASGCVRQAVAGTLVNLAAANLVLKRGKNSRVSTALARLLAPGVITATDLDVVVAGVDCVYAVRNDLFHGTRDLATPVERQQLRDAAALVLQVNRYSLSRHMCGKTMPFPRVKQQTPPS